MKKLSSVLLVFFICLFFVGQNTALAKDYNSYGISVKTKCVNGVCKHEKKYLSQAEAKEKSLKMQSEMKSRMDEMRKRMNEIFKKSFRF